MRLLFPRLLCLLMMGLVALPAMAADTLAITQYGRTPVGPNPLAEIEEEHRQSLEFATPHTDWATPYARGKVRVLFFCQIGRWDTLSREGVELMQRFDVTVDAVYGDFRKGQDPGDLWIGGKAGEARMMRLLEQPHDVFLFMHVSPRNLPPRVRDKLVNAVAAGVGLVLVGTDDRPGSRTRKPETSDDPDAGGEEAMNTEMLRGEDRLVELPAMIADEPDAQVYEVERGRAVVLPPRPTQLYAPGWEAAYDYWQERLGRTLLWAAKHEPVMALRVTLPATINWLEPAKATLAWEKAPTGATVELRIQLEDGRVIPLGTKPLPAAAGELPVPLPRLPAGTQHLDAIVKSPAGVEAWAATPFSVTSSRTMALTLSKDWGEIGEQVTGNCQLTGPALPNETLRVNVLDRRGRILLRKELPVADPVKAFAIPLEAWMPMLLRVNVVLASNGAEVASAGAYANVTQRHQDQFNFVMWDCPAGTAAGYAQEALARGGVTVVLGQGNPRREQAAYDVAWIPYTTYIKNKLTSDGITADGCWNDLALQTKHVAEIAAEHLPSRKHGVFVYSLGDEGDVAGSCLHPDCLAAYRKFLLRNYGAIGALNASWGTQFASFDAVTLSVPEKKSDPASLDTEEPSEDPLPDNDEQVAFAQQNYPRWYDRVAFQRENLVRYCTLFRDAYRKMDPRARTGFEGSGGAPFGLGADVELITRELQFWGPYPSNADELLNALAPRALVRSNWMGYAREADGLLLHYWRTFTRGSDSVFWWMCTGVGSYHGFLAPDFAPFAATKTMLADTQIVRDGLGDLLLRGTRLDDGIALYYSMPAECASGIGAGATFGLATKPGNFVNHVDEQAAWHQALREQGMQFTYVTDHMLATAPLSPARYKVLILPRAEAISDAAAKAIRAYVEAGGTVIADVRPGLYNEHCKRRTTGCLDELFGITRGEDADAAVADVAINGTLAGRPLALVWRVADAGAAGGNTAYGPRVDPAVAVKGGTACSAPGATPLCIMRQTGKGRAVLLNFTLAACFPTKWVYKPSAFPVPEPILTFLGTLLASAGVEPAVKLVDAQGRPARNVEIIRWRNGESTVLALLRQSGEAETVRLVLPRAQMVYHLRTGTCAGAVAELPVRLTPNSPTWLSLAPKAEPAAVCAAATRQVAGGQVLRVAVSVPGSTGLHALRIRVRKPDGGEADWVKPVLLASAQPTELFIPIAYNDPPGDWTLDAADLLGGHTVLSFHVSATP